MAALITVRKSGTIAGRCDEHCYDAVLPRCRCCCGGKNHGKGKEQAIENTREMYAAQITRLCAEIGIDVDDVQIHKEVKQLSFLI